MNLYDEKEQRALDLLEKAARAFERAYEIGLIQNDRAKAVRAREANKVLTRMASAIRFGGAYRLTPMAEDFDKSNPH